MSNHSLAVIGEFQTIYFIIPNKLSLGTLFVVLSKIFISAYYNEVLFFFFINYKSKPII